MPTRKDIKWWERCQSPLTQSIKFIPYFQIFTQLYGKREHCDKCHTPSIRFKSFEIPEGLIPRISAAAALFPSHLLTASRISCCLASFSVGRFLKKQKKSPVSVSPGVTIPSTNLCFAICSLKRFIESILD